MGLKDYLVSRQKCVESALDRYLPKANVKPATLHKAMRYSMFAGGKRLRPILCLAAAEACGGNPENALPSACAVECIHTYSLIHDDLPCMDNDDYRRGKLTSHKVFGDAVAVLAGDALLTLAFEIVSQSRQTKRYAATDFVRELAIASGSKWLIAGQVADLEGEGKTIRKKELEFIHRAKTAALLTSTIRLGAMSANASELQLAKLTQYGQSLGLAFQVIDDILDVTQTSEKLGKSAGKDVSSQKATYPSVLGLDKAKKEARRLTETAHSSLKSFGKKGEVLRELSEHLLNRDY